MKPTFNTISTQGVKLCSFQIDTIGYFARSIEDLQLLTDVFDVGSNKPDKDLPLSQIKVALLRTPLWPHAGPDTSAAMEKAAAILRRHGVTVEEKEFPQDFNEPELLKRTHKLVITTDAHALFLREYRMDETKLKLDPKIRGFVENAFDTTYVEVREAFDRYASLRPVFDNIAANYSVLITPSATDEAPLGLADMGSGVLNFFWTVSYHPPTASISADYYGQGAHLSVINVPAFVGSNNMPIGLSLVAGRFRDQHLLSIDRTLNSHLMKEGGWKDSGRETI